MFKFSAVSQIWKKYIQKLNDWDRSLIATAEYGINKPGYNLWNEVVTHIRT